jgi:hypothetical protein
MARADRTTVANFDPTDEKRLTDNDHTTSHNHSGLKQCFQLMEKPNGFFNNYALTFGRFQDCASGSAEGLGKCGSFPQKAVDKLR